MFLGHYGVPLVPGSSTRVGLGLWHSIPGTLIVEFALYAAGIAIYLRATRATDAVGRYALWGLILVLAVVYLSSLVGPPPPSERSLALFALGDGSSGPGPTGSTATAPPHRC